MSFDPEILNDFTAESNKVLAELEVVLGQLEDFDGEFPDALLADFAQKIDRIMGAAQTLSLLHPEHMGLVRIGKLAGICKSIGYKAAEKRAVELIPFFAAFWADTTEVIGQLIKTIEDLKKNEEIAKAFSAVLQSRLEWLAKKINEKSVSAAAKDFK